MECVSVIYDTARSGDVFLSFVLRVYGAEMFSDKIFNPTECVYLQT